MPLLKGVAAQKYEQITPSLKDCVKLIKENKLDGIITTLQTPIFNEAEIGPEDKAVVKEIQDLSKKQISSYKGFKGTFNQFFSACKNLYTLGQFTSSGTYLNTQVNHLMEQLPKTRDELKVEYFDELDVFAKDKDESIQEAINLIKACVNEESEELRLSNLDLTELPPIQKLGKLNRFKQLILTHNRLKNLPEYLPSLTELELLDLSDNDIDIFPESIFKLTPLKFLDLSHNNLRTIPESIKNLNLLEYFCLIDNKLESLPESISYLTLLEEFKLKKNPLKTLPLSIGGLTNLKNLDLENNKELRELPLSLGSIATLRSIDTLGTKILTGDKQSILNSCRTLRDKAVKDTLPSRILLWTSIGKSTKDLNPIFSFDEHEKTTVNEWLNRLEGTKDFKGSQQKLAFIVCEILYTFIENKEFQGLFMNQVETNLECCQDRAAMALNELYTSWKIISLKEDAPIKIKLELLISCAKTLALRAALSSLIKENELESVEIYLYYETLLKEPLKLMSVISHMAHEEIGKREGIQKSYLIEQVENTYLDHLVNLPQIQQIAQEDTLFKACWEAQDDSFNRRLEKIIEPSNVNEFSSNYLEYKIKCKEILQEKNISYKEHLKMWVLDILKR